MLVRLRAFRQLYQAALSKWMAGIHSVVFPVGTYAMRAIHGAAVEICGRATAMAFAAGA
jgi:hypothetical protein